MKTIKHYCTICKTIGLLTMDNEIFDTCKPEVIAEFLCNDCANEKLANDFDYQYPNFELDVV